MSSDASFERGSFHLLAHWMADFVAKAASSVSGVEGLEKVCCSSALKASESMLTLWLSCLRDLENELRRGVLVENWWFVYFQMHG